MKTKQSKPSPRTVNPSTAREAYEIMLPRFLAMPPSELLPIVVEIPFATEIVLGAADRAQSLLPILSKVPFYDTRPLVEIKTIAAACLYAHLLATEPEPNVVAPMIAEGFKLRGDLLVAAEALAHFGMVPAETVANIRAGTGHIDMANDLVQLANLFDGAWDRVKQHTVATRAMTDRADELGLALHAAMGTRRLDADPVDVDRDPRRIRERAYTMLVRAWDECRRGVAFVRWHEQDADQFAPSLFLKRRRRSASNAALQSPELESELPVPTDLADAPDSPPTTPAETVTEDAITPPIA